VRLSADRKSLRADGQDLSFVTVETLDSEGRFQPNAGQEVQFAISGPGAIAAVGNGDGKDGASYQGDRRKLFQGRALVVVRTSKQTGPIQLTASAPGLSAGVVTMEAKAAPRPELP
jgi:beta-galactosidase